MLGKTSRELVSGRTSPGVSTELSAQDERLRSIYCSQDGLSPEDCVESLKTVVGQGKHERKQENLRDSTRGYPIRWNERPSLWRAQLIDWRLSATNLLKLFTLLLSRAIVGFK